MRYLVFMRLQQMYQGSMNPMNPPCFAGATVLKFYEVADRKATPVAQAPVSQMVERD